jgi:hypothetical protein
LKGFQNIIIHQKHQEGHQSCNRKFNNEIDDTLECKVVFLIVGNSVKVGREVDQQTDC